MKHRGEESMKATSETQALRTAIVGTWLFDSYFSSNLDGSEVEYPFGENAKGTLIYTPEGIMSVQIGTPARPAFADGAVHGGTDAERAAAAAGYLAYSGRYTVEDDVVLHLPTISLFPNWEDAGVPRRATIEGEVLTLELLEPITQHGRQRTGVLRWRRAALPES